MGQNKAARSRHAGGLSSRKRSDHSLVRAWSIAELAGYGYRTVTATDADVEDSRVASPENTARTWYVPLLEVA